MRPSLLALLVLAGWSCGGRPTSPRREDAGSPDATDDAATDAMSQAQVAAARGFCAQLRDQDAAWRARCLGGTAQDWRAHLELSTSCEEVGALVAAGTVRYRPDLAQSCLVEAAADRDCARPGTLCLNLALEGALTVDAPCKNDLECPPHAGCWASGEFGHNACVTSTCVHLPDEEGAPCMQDPFPYCFAGLSCINGACVRKGAEGQACAGLAGCVNGLRCDAGVCRKRSDGGPCVADEDCVPTQYCSRQTQVCVQRSGVGGSCSTDVPTCAAFTACGGQGACVAAGHIGQPCARVEGHFVCAEGVCGGLGTCGPKLPDGSDCFTGAVCASGGCAELSCKTCD